MICTSHLHLSDIVISFITSLNGDEIRDARLFPT